MGDSTSNTSLRLLTCGNVDDGKSSLIGRLLFDSHQVYDDQLAAIEKVNKRVGHAGERVDLALLVDGLQSEREQGITIDVAYRYFHTPARHFIIADCPGHVQYTRNMATGASNCEVAVVIIDATKGVRTQTKRHSYICSLLGIKHLIVAVNKMDLVDYSQDVYRAIKSEFKAFAQTLAVKDVRFVPVSALLGDNVVDASDNLHWYPGATLLRLLETIRISKSSAKNQFRFPVQWVNRPDSKFRGYCGTIASGTVSVGDEIVVLPSSQRSRISGLLNFEGSHTTAVCADAITITLEDELDIARGDVLVRPGEWPTVGHQFCADLVWMSEQPLSVEKQYSFKIATKTVLGCVADIEYEVDINTFEKNQAARLELNAIARCVIRLEEQTVLGTYGDSRVLGAFIVIDRISHATVAAGMIRSFKADPAEPESEQRYSEFEIEFNALVRKHYPEWGCKSI